MFVMTNKDIGIALRRAKKDADFAIKNNEHVYPAVAMSIQPRTGTKRFLVSVGSKSPDHLLVQFGKCQFPTKVGAERFEKGIREGFSGIVKPDLVAVTFHRLPSKSKRMSASSIVPRKSKQPKEKIG
jgi:hypothetical protein